MQSQDRSAPLRVALVYTAGAGLWLLLSERLLGLLIPDPTVISLIETFIGWGLIGGAGMLLYLLLRSEQEARHRIEVERKASEDRFARDIDEAKRAQQALLEANQTLRAIIESSPLSILLLDTEGRVKLWNPAAERVFGWTEEDTLGRIPPFVPPDQVDEYFVILQNTLQQQPVSGHELRRLRKDGSYVDVSLSTAVLTGEGGEVVGIVSMHEDITDRKRAEEALRESEARFRRLAENASDVIYRWRMTEPMGFDYVSPAAVTVTGYTPDELYANHHLVFDIVHPDDRALVEELPTRTMPGEAFTMRWIRKDGELIWTDHRTTPVYDADGRLIAIEGIVRDVTELVTSYQTLERRVEERTREIERRRQVAESLRDVLRILNSDRPLDEILGYIVEQVSRVLGSDAAAIYRLETPAGPLRIQAARGLDEDYVANIRIPLGLPAVGVAVVRREPVAVEDVQRMDLAADGFEPDQVALLAQFSQKFRSVLAVPIIVKDQVYGGLVLYSHEPREMPEETEQLAVTFADQIALAIENADLRAQAEQRTRRLEVLYQADQQLHRSLRLGQVFQALVDVAVDIARADKSALLVWDEPRQSLAIGAARGFREESVSNLTLSAHDWALGIAVQTAEPVIVEDALEDSRVRSDLLTAEQIRAFIHVPIVIGGKVFGVFNVNYTEPRAFSHDEVRLVLALAQRAGLAIENARLYEQAQQAATLEERQRLARELHDAVTQTLFSASLIAEVLPRIWERDVEVGRKRLEELRQLTRGALAEMRTLLIELRPTALTEAPLVDLLRQLSESVTGRARIPIQLEVEGEPYMLPPDAQVALYRIAQESLNNLVKHARASQGTVRVCYHHDGVELSVEDNGQGFDPTSIPPEHFGVGIMRERAAAIGASLSVDSRHGEGTRVSVVWRNLNREEAA